MDVVMRKEATPGVNGANSRVTILIRRPSRLASNSRSEATSRPPGWPTALPFDGLSLRLDNFTISRAIERMQISVWRRQRRGGTTTTDNTSPTTTTTE